MVGWNVLRHTVGACFRYRVTGLAAEVGFFALLSLPPLLLGLVGSLGFVVRPLLGDDVVEEVRTSILDSLHTALANTSVDSVVQDTFNDVSKRGRIDIVSIGFVLALWSGSRALNVYIDTVTIMYGLGGHRGIIRTRALSVTLYVLALLTGSVALPLVVAGPSLVADALPKGYGGWVQAAYWPTVLLLCVLFLATLYHFAVPIRGRWRRDLPGAVLAVALWLVLSWVLRTVIAASVGGSSTSIYGPLSAPILVLVWLYFLAISVLIGAAFNAALDDELRIGAERRRRARARAQRAAAAPAAPTPPPHENPLTPLPDEPGAPAAPR
ncbi:membrane protein [Motilibacter rhizosphaerae]|uniref:Membrane protein n=1 Tax=Motilibacter rhizosphaerae TaxID=598652 RepID=A0A4Q7NQY8_9ACTN|nr:membrane protein [Motilibacter rhizosphaerae]